MEGLGSPHYYTASSQDVANRFAASALLYGSPALVPIPDLHRTSFLLMVGANPFVSHGSVLTRAEDQGAAARRSSSAAAGSSSSTRVAPRPPATSSTSPCAPTPTPGCCSRCSACSSRSGSPTRRRSRARPRAGRACATWRSGSRPRRRPRAPASRRTSVRALARDLAGRRSRRGLRAHRIVPRALRHARLVPARRAHARDGQPRPRRRRRVRRSRRSRSTRSPQQAGLDTYGKVRSRLGDFPDVLGALPASLLAEEMTTPGDGSDPRVLHERRATPCSRAPTATRSRRRSRGSTCSCRSTSTSTRPTGTPTTSCRARRGSSATTCRSPSSASTRRRSCSTPRSSSPPRGEAREEWEIIDVIAREIGVHPYALPALRVLSKLGYRMTPQRLVDLLLRTGREGDRFGLRRGGLSLKALRAQPHGVVTGAEHPDRRAPGPRAPRRSQGPPRPPGAERGDRAAAAPSTATTRASRCG